MALIDATKCSCLPLLEWAEEGAPVVLRLTVDLDKDGRVVAMVLDPAGQDRRESALAAFKLAVNSLTRSKGGES